MRLPFALAALALVSTPCYAQKIAPSRTYTDSPPLPGNQFRQGMNAAIPNKPVFGFHETPLKPVNITPTLPPRLATQADTTSAEPLTLSHPGSGKMTDMYDLPPDDTALPGQKRDPALSAR